MDIETQRHFFVGDSCLKELVQRGAILRKFGKQSGKQAYEAEIKLQGLGPQNNAVPPQANGTEGTGAKASLCQGAHHNPEQPESRSLAPIVIIFESPDSYQAMVCLVSERGEVLGYGSATESRCEEVWGIRAGGVLEKVRKERLNAPALCLTRVWQQAYAQRPGPSLMQPIAVHLGEDHPTDAQCSAVPVLWLGSVSEQTGQHGR